MDLRPWGYFTRDGQPHEETNRVQSALEYVLARHELHPGALHLWIHLWESTDPKRAEDEADRLVPLMPGAGHMVHMPAHIYQRVGRHADVIRVNQLAAKADEDYIAQCRAQGIYPLAYYPHNLHFIWMGASASGQKTLAIESARKLAARGAARGAHLCADPAGIPGRAVLRDGPLQRLGRDPRRAGAVFRFRVHAQHLALRARLGARQSRPPRRGRSRARRDQDAGGRCIAQGPDDVLLEHAATRSSDCAGDCRR